MLTVSIDLTNWQKAKDAINADIYLKTRMKLKEGCDNVWIVNDEIIRKNNEGLKFVMDFVTCMENNGVPRDTYSFGTKIPRNKDHSRHRALR